MIVSTIILSVYKGLLAYLCKHGAEFACGSFYVIDVDGFYRDLSFVYKNSLSGNASKYYIFFDKYRRGEASNAPFFILSRFLRVSTVFLIIKYSLIKSSEK